MGKAILLKKTRRVVDKIIDLICKDQLDEIMPLIPYLGHEYNKNYKNKFVIVAVTHCSEKCANFFIKDGAILNLNRAFNDCKWNRCLEVYHLCQSLSEIFELEFTYNTKQVIERILEPSRVNNNPERIEYFFEMVRSGFTTLEDARYAILELQNKTTKPERTKRILRELSFYDLGI